MNALDFAAKEWSNDELILLMNTFAQELRARLLAERNPPPASALPPVEGPEILELMGRASGLGSATKRLRRMTFAGKPRKPNLRIVAADERPERMQWNEALKAWG